MLLKKAAEAATWWRSESKDEGRRMGTLKRAIQSFAGLGGPQRILHLQQAPPMLKPALLAGELTIYGETHPSRPLERNQNQQVEQAHLFTFQG